MEKTAIDIDILLPEVPDDHDACVQRIIDTLQNKRGIDKVHVVPVNHEKKAKLCFHYNPEEILISEVEDLAREAGGRITQKYGHLLLGVKGVRHPRHARILEGKIRGLRGVIFVSVSGTGYIQLEYDKEQNNRANLLQEIAELGLTVTSRKTNDDRLNAVSTKKEISTHHDDTEAKEEHDHHHGHLNFFGERTELIFAIICGVALVAGFGLSLISSVPAWIPLTLYILAYLSGGFFTTLEAVNGIRGGRFEIDFLMIVAAIGAAFLGKWAEGSLLLFLFSLGHSLEHYALQRARKSIEALSKLYPKTALLKVPGGIREVLVEELEVGQHIIVRPNSVIGADGVVIEGNSAVNESAITGESMPVDKYAFPDDIRKMKDFSRVDLNNKVFAGTINGNQVLEVYIAKLSTDSTLARMIHMVSEAQTQKSETQRFTDRIERYYVPSVLVLVALLLFAFLVRAETFGQSFYRAMAVLIAASPCALAISTPSAVLSGIARAARGGVLIKGGKPLEELGKIQAIAFDKTGTLTKGKPELTGVYPLANWNEASLLELVVAVEKLSDHPLAAAIVKGGEERLGRVVDPAKNLQSLIARGIEADYHDKQVLVGNLRLFMERKIEINESERALVQEKEKEGNTTMLVGFDGSTAGVITLKDVPRKEAFQTIQSIKKHDIKHLVMLTGDNQRVADAVAKELEIPEARGSLLPEEKVSAVEALRKQYGKVAMVGDGVNDAPAMARSNVSIAMGAAGSPLALETADVALLADNLFNLPFAIGLSRKAMAIIRQNLFISIGMVVILIPLTIAGLSIAPAVVGHEGSTMVVVLNALRLLGYKKQQ